MRTVGQISSLQVPNRNKMIVGSLVVTMFVKTVANHLHNTKQMR